MLFIRIIVVICILGIALYSYIDQNNRLTSLRISLPILEKKLRDLSHENTRLQFEIEKIENPINLIQLSRKPQFSHYKQPLISEIIYFHHNDIETKQDLDKGKSR